MKFLKLAMKNKEADSKSWNTLYEREIEKEIRLKYSLNSELAILRQRDTKPKEFEAYNTYVEQCKLKVKQAMGISTIQNGKEVSDG